MSKYREQLEAYLKTISVKANSVLDIGGGENPIKGRTASWEVKSYKIADNDKSFKPDYLVDLNFPMTKELKEEVVKFDVVFCLEVMEYIWRPYIAHQNIFNFLKPDGKAYISYPTIYPLHNPPNIDYLRYSKHAIEKLLKETSFSTWSIIPRVATLGTSSLGEFYRVEEMHPIKRTSAIYDIGYLVEAHKNG